MKANVHKLPGSTAQHLAFALTCLVLVAGGWWAKAAVDQFIAVHDQIDKDLALPSPVFLWCNSKHREITAPTPARPVEQGPETRWRTEMPLLTGQNVAGDAVR